MELTSHDNQPFTGGVSGEVMVRAEADRSTMVEAIDAALPPGITEAWLVVDGDAETRVAVRPSTDGTGEAE